MCAGPQETAGQIAPELNEFEKQGIQFRVITEDMIPVCLDFLWEQFAPQVPISYIVSLTDSNGFVFFANPDQVLFVRIGI